MVVVEAGVEVDIVVRRAIPPKMDIKPARSSSSSSKDRAGTSKVGISSSSGLRDRRPLLRLRTLESFWTGYHGAQGRFNSRRFLFRSCLIFYLPREWRLCLLRFFSPFPAAIEKAGCSFFLHWSGLELGPEIEAWA